MTSCSLVNDSQNLRRTFFLLLNYIYMMRNLNNASLYWFRHYATSLKVAGSIPDEVTGVFFFT
jgi:hypothetical protein